MHKHVHQPAAVKNGPRHDHAVDEFGALDVDFLKDDTADAQTHKVRFVNAEVVDDPQNVFRHNVKIVGWELGQDVLAQPMVPQVEEKQPVMGSERFNLELPRPNGPTAP